MLAEPFEAFTFSPVRRGGLSTRQFWRSPQGAPDLIADAMSAQPTRLANVPLGREIGVHRRASWRIETGSISARAGNRPCDTASRSRLCVAAAFPLATSE